MTAEEQKQFKESQDNVANLTAQVRRLQEAETLRNGADIVRGEILAVRNLPELSKSRLLESAATYIRHKDDHSLDVDATKAAAKALVESEVKYVAQLMGTGRVVGLGESARADEEPKPEELDAALSEAFSGMGYEGDALKNVAKGRN